MFDWLTLKNKIEKARENVGWGGFAGDDGENIWKLMEGIEKKEPFASLRYQLLLTILKRVITSIISPYSDVKFLEEFSGITKQALQQINAIEPIDKNNADQIFLTLQACKLLDDEVSKIKKDSSAIFSSITSYLGWDKTESSSLWLKKKEDLTPTIFETIRALILLDKKIQWKGDQWHNYLPMIAVLMRNEGFKNLILNLIHPGVSSERSQYVMKVLLIGYSNSDKTIDEKIEELSSDIFNKDIKPNIKWKIIPNFRTREYVNNNENAKIQSIQECRSTQGYFFKVIFSLPCIISLEWLDKNISTDGTVEIYSKDKEAYEKICMLEKIEWIDPDVIVDLYKKDFLCNNVDMIVANMLERGYAQQAYEIIKHNLNAPYVSRAIWYVINDNLEKGLNDEAVKDTKEMLSWIKFFKQEKRLTKEYQDFINKLDQTDVAVLFKLKDETKDLSTFDYVKDLLLSFAKKGCTKEKQLRVLDAIIAEFPLSPVAQSAKGLKREISVAKTIPALEKKETGEKLVEHKELKLVETINFTSLNSQDTISYETGMVVKPLPYNPSFIDKVPQLSQLEEENRELIRQLSEEVTVLKEEKNKLKSQLSEQEERFKTGSEILREEVSASVLALQKMETIRALQKIGTFSKKSNVTLEKDTKDKQEPFSGKGRVLGTGKIYIP